MSFDDPPSVLPENAGRTEICITATLRPMDPELMAQFTIAQIVNQTSPVFAVSISASGAFFPATGNNSS